MRQSSRALLHACNAWHLLHRRGQTATLARFSAACIAEDWCLHLRRQVRVNSRVPRIAAVLETRVVLIALPRLEYFQQAAAAPPAHVHNRLSLFE